MQEITTPKTYIFREGDPGDKFYILLHGKVNVVAGANLTMATLDAQGSGEDGTPFFGETAMLSSRPRQASVVTASAQCSAWVGHGSEAQPRRPAR